MRAARESQQGLADLRKSNMARTLRWHPEIFQMMDEVSGGYYKTNDESPVDWSIYDALVALNKLPFVRGTIFSCAGYGMIADIDPSKMIHLGEHAYVMLSYRMEDPRVAPFHKEMRKISASAEKHKSEKFLAHPLGKTIVTYFAVPSIDMRALQKTRLWRRALWAKKVEGREEKNLAWIENVKKLAEKYAA